MISFLAKKLGSLKKCSDYVGLISGIIAIIEAIVSAVGHFANFLSIKVNVIFLVLAFCCLFVSLVFYFIGYQMEKANIKKMSEKFYDLLHDYRNNMSEFNKNYSNRQINSDLEREFTKDIKSTIKGFLDDLVGTITTDCGQQVSACVKLVDFSEGGSRLRDCTVSTFVRDSNCDPRRKTLDQHTGSNKTRIKDNTAFKYFCDNKSKTFKDAIFYQADLEKYDKSLRSQGLRYENTTVDYQDYYIGTAVAPIRINTKKIDKNAPKDVDEYRTVGFLCVDSLATNVFTNKNRALYSYLVKAYAALLFQVLHFYNSTLINGKQST